MPHREFLQDYMEEHDRILEDFADLPKSIRKHIQTFYKSDRPEKCSQCQNVCYGHHLSEAYSTKWSPICTCRQCEITNAGMPYYEDMFI